MCGHGRNTARYEARCASRATRMQQRFGQSGSGNGLADIIGAIQGISLAAHGIDSSKLSKPTVMSPTYNTQFDAQTRGVERGVTLAHHHMVDEKYHIQQQEKDVGFEELPSYEESAGIQSPAQAKAVPAQREIPFIPATTQPQQQEHSNATAAVLNNLDSFRTSLLSYRTGVSGSKKDVKRAAKRFARDLLDQEIAKRRSEKGYLECGERKQVKRDIRPAKQMLKDAVKDARHERLGRC